MTKLKHYFKKFEATGVNIKYFALAIEKIYTNLKMEVADEPVRWEPVKESLVTLI